MELVVVKPKARRAPCLSSQSQRQPRLFHAESKMSALNARKEPHFDHFEMAMEEKNKA